MNDWFKKVLDNLKTAWGKWSLVQKLILFGVIGAVIIAIVMLTLVSSSATSVNLLHTPVTDPVERSRILNRASEMGIVVTVTEDGMMSVANQEIARGFVAVLAEEDLLPSETSLLSFMDLSPLSITSLERNARLQEDIRRKIESFIEATDGVANARLEMVIAETATFTEDQQPNTAAVALTPTIGSDVTTNLHKIKGIEQMVLRSIPGLQKENLTITDHQGLILNNYEDLRDFDRLTLSQKQLETKREEERKLKNLILKELEVIMPRRARILNVDIDLDFSEESETRRELLATTVREDNPLTPRDESEVVLSIASATQQGDLDWEGRGINPQGVAGVDGQIAPGYKDQSNMTGHMSDQDMTATYDYGTKESEKIHSPVSIEKISIGVAVDGSWREVYNEAGNRELTDEGGIQREYTPVSEAELKNLTLVLESALGVDKLRGDVVTIVHQPFDRSAIFAEEDEKYRAQRRMQKSILWSAVGVVALVIAFIVFRLISREVERRRRLREEELSRQHAAMREAALRSAEEEGLEVQMSVEDRARLEMQENAINMAREHPEDVAQLIRTWLIEE